MLKLGSISLFLIALVIVGCQANPTTPIQTQTKTATATQNPSPIATETPTSPPATATSTRIPPSPTLSFTRTPIPATSTPTPSPTPQLTTRSQDGKIMVLVPAGEFMMGSPAGEGGDDEVPQHKVTLDGYWIDRTEVTNAQYRSFVEATGYRMPTTCDWGDPTYADAAKTNHPVVCVSRDDAQAYCEWAGARLPTEAEWEKAARGTDRRTYPWGIGFDGTRLNYCDINCEGEQRDPTYNDGYAQTAPVGSYLTGVSPYGALDMAGNVWEWVSDWYNFYYYTRSPESNPQGPNSGQYGVLRGGSWWGFFTNARTGFRANLEPDKRESIIGFRCVVPFTSSP